MRRLALATLIVVTARMTIGCAGNAGVGRDEGIGISPQWPPAPQAARISYRYSVAKPADLNIHRSLFGKVWRLISGAEADKISRPQGVHVDPTGRLYVVDAAQRRVHVFDIPDSDYFWFPAKPVARFEYPVGVAADGYGRVYVSDSSAKVIHVFAAFGREYLTSFGMGQLKRPTGLAVRPEANQLLVVDTLASSILIFDTRDFAIIRRTGYAGSQPDALHYPTNISQAGNGDVFVTDALNFRIRILDPDLGFKGGFGQAGDGPGFFSRPKGVAVDSDDNIYVVDALFDNVQIFDRDGQLLMAFGTAGHGPGEFWLPSDIFIDSHDLIYVSDTYNARVQVFQYHSQAAR